MNRLLKQCAVFLFFVFVLFCTNANVKADYNETYYNFYITQEQKILVYENYGSNNYYNAVLEIGYWKDSNGILKHFHQIRKWENGINVVLYSDETSFSDWINEISPQNNCDYINVWIMNNDGINYNVQTIVEIYRDPDPDTPYWDVTPLSYNGDYWVPYSFTFSTQFQNYVNSLYGDASYEPIYPTSIYDVYYNYSELLSSTIIDYDDAEYDFYFSNLKNNYPSNYDGSCSYVAMSILLSYYDTFYNGDIVYNNMGLITKASTPVMDVSYCTNSPGPSELFKSMLVNDVAGYLGMFDPANPEYGLDNDGIETILDYYMRWFSDYQCSYSINELNTINAIINEIDSGRPVILTMYDYAYCENVTINGITRCLPKYHEKCGHAMIAYGYEINNEGEIFFRCHTGWKTSNTNINLTDIILKPMNKTTFSAISLRLINNVHVHSDNYLLGGISICPCYSTLPNNFQEYFYDIIINELENREEIIYYYNIENEGENNHEENY